MTLPKPGLKLDFTDSQPSPTRVGSARGSAIDFDFAPDRPEFYLGDPHAAFAHLRSNDPLPWYEPGDFWAVTRHADIQAISRSAKNFSSAHGTQIFEIPLYKSNQAPMRGKTATSIIQMDPPEHNRHRKLVIQAFTARTIQRLEPRIREIARQSLETVPTNEVVDFVEAVAIPLPMLVIAELLGVSPSDYQDFRRWSDAMIEAGGGGVSQETVATISELFAYFSKTLVERRKSPRNDLVSLLLTAEIEGERLSEPEILMFLMTLLVAGNETTRNLISVGSQTLLEHPDQLRSLIDSPELIPNGVEEMLRWVTPVQTFVRRAMRDTRLCEQIIAKGDYLCLLYGSANRDEAVFGKDAHLFDVRRQDASRHLAFGFGEHLCMGASLARLEAIVLFEELFRLLPRFELAGTVRRLPSILMNGIVEMPVVFES